MHFNLEAGRMAAIAIGGAVGHEIAVAGVETTVEAAVKWPTLVVLSWQSSQALAIAPLPWPVVANDDLSRLAEEAEAYSGLVTLRVMKSLSLYEVLLVPV